MRALVALCYALALALVLHRLYLHLLVPLVALAP
jgi:hypothetical protein